MISRAGSWKKIELAESYYHQMISSGISADVKAYNSLINAYAKGGNTEKAMQVLSEMERTDYVTPDIVTFNTLVDSCARAGDVTKAQEILEMMEKR
jgi:pentatricopeptide repeat protein